MTSEFDDLRCTACGAPADCIQHIQQPQCCPRTGRALEPVWRNRCTACATVSEYIPTRAEIAAECQRILAERAAEQGADFEYE